MRDVRQTTIPLNLRERPTREAITDAVRKLVRPWVDSLAAEGLTCEAPVFNLRPDATDPWTTHLDVSVQVSANESFRPERGDA
jgi:hypothetical protein